MNSCWKNNGLAGSAKSYDSNPKSPQTASVCTRTGELLRAPHSSSHGKPIWFPPLPVVEDAAPAVIIIHWGDAEDVVSLCTEILILSPRGGVGGARSAGHVMPSALKASCLLKPFTNALFDIYFHAWTPSYTGGAREWNCIWVDASPYFGRHRLNVRVSPFVLRIYEQRT